MKRILEFHRGLSEFKRRHRLLTAVRTLQKLDTREYIRLFGDFVNRTDIGFIIAFKRFLSSCFRCGSNRIICRGILLGAFLLRLGKCYLLTAVIVIFVLFLRRNVLADRLRILGNARERNQVLGVNLGNTGMVFLVSCMIRNIGGFRVGSCRRRVELAVHLALIGRNIRCVTENRLIIRNVGSVMMLLVYGRLFLAVALQTVDDARLLLFGGSGHFVDWSIRRRRSIDIYENKLLAAVLFLNLLKAHLTVFVKIGSGLSTLRFGCLTAFFLFLLLFAELAHDGTLLGALFLNHVDDCLAAYEHDAYKHKRAENQNRGNISEQRKQRARKQLTD